MVVVIRAIFSLITSGGGGGDDRSATNLAIARKMGVEMEVWKGREWE